MFKGQCFASSSLWPFMDDIAFMVYLADKILPTQTEGQSELLERPINLHLYFQDGDELCVTFQ